VLEELVPEPLADPDDLEDEPEDDPEVE